MKGGVKAKSPHFAKGQHSRGPAASARFRVALMPPLPQQQIGQMGVIQSQSPHG